MELLEVADVVRGDGHWTAGSQYDSPGCSMRSFTAPACEPEREPLSNEDQAEDEPASECGVDGFPFAVITSIESRARDVTTDFKSWVSGALDAESEKALGEFFALGSDAIPAEDRVASLAADEVPHITGGIADGLRWFWDNTVGVPTKDMLLHLGASALFEVSGKLTADGTRILGFPCRVVCSPGYPDDLVAVTGPVLIHLGTDQVLEEYNTSINSRETEATRFVSLEFDPCNAVVVDPLVEP